MDSQFAKGAWTCHVCVCFVFLFLPRTYANRMANTSNKAALSRFFRNQTQAAWLAGPMLDIGGNLNKIDQKQPSEFFTGVFLCLGANETGGFLLVSRLKTKKQKGCQLQQDTHSNGSDSLGTLGHGDCVSPATGFPGGGGNHWDLGSCHRKSKSKQVKPKCHLNGNNVSKAQFPFQLKQISSKTTPKVNQAGVSFLRALLFWWFRRGSPKGTPGCSPL